VTADGKTPKGAATVVATLIDGTNVEVAVSHATGSIERPMTDEALLRKAQHLTEPILGDRTADFLNVAFAVDEHGVPALVEAAMPLNLRRPAARPMTI
jgi:hypothetical protein